MSGINTTIANYIAAWNETDAGKRRDVIANAWTEAGTYLTPTIAPDGRLTGDRLHRCNAERDLKHADRAAGRAIP